MTAVIRTTRAVSLAMAGVVSLIAAVLLAERIIRPGIIDDFGTAALLGLLMLFMLPAITLLALRNDRRHALIAVGREQAETAAQALLASEEGQLALPEIDPRTVRHGAHPRPPLISAGRTAEGPSSGTIADRAQETHPMG